MVSYSTETGECHQVSQHTYNKDIGELRSLIRGRPATEIGSETCDVGLCAAWIGRIIGVLRLQAKYRRA